MRKTILGLAAPPRSPPRSLAASAHAATIDEAGKGFVGKGEVQTAFGWNNATMQKNQTDVTFTAEQPTTQSLTQSVSQTGVEHNFQMGVQSATQTGTQSGTQVVSQDLTCEFTNGSGTKTFHRDGIRDGDRTGTREGTREGERDVARLGERFGTRTGTQSGTQTGSIVSALERHRQEDRPVHRLVPQGLHRHPTYTETGSPVWDAPTFGDYEFGEPHVRRLGLLLRRLRLRRLQLRRLHLRAVSGTEWGEWDAAPGREPGRLPAQPER